MVQTKINLIHFITTLKSLFTSKEVLIVFPSLVLDWAQKLQSGKGRTGDMVVLFTSFLTYFSTPQSLSHYVTIYVLAT